LAINKDALFSQLANLYTSAQKGDSKAVSECLKDVVDSVQRRVELGRELTSQVKDPQLRKQILEASENLENCLPEMIIKSKDALQHPGDQECLQKLQEVIDTMIEESSRITASKATKESQKRRSILQPLDDDGIRNNHDSSIEEAVIIASQMRQYLDQFAQCVKQRDTKGTVESARIIKDLISKQIELGQKLAANCSDPELKKKILDACSTLDNLAVELITIAKHLLQNPDDQNAREKLDQLIEKAKAASKVISDAAEKLRSQNMKLDDITENMRDRMDLFDKGYSEYKADGTKDEIMIAAQSVNSVAQNAREPTIPSQKSLLDIAKNIAVAMEQLSLAAQKGSKRDMILSARNIANMVHQIEEFSSDIASKCSDLILRKQLLGISQAPKNFSIQLKIICAVKDSNVEHDPMAEAQLVVCAQGLANSVIQTVKAAEIASIKCSKSITPEI